MLCLCFVQVQFGAHQAILVRSREAEAALPGILRDSNALVLTIAQAKGLEFDQVGSKGTSPLAAQGNCC